MLVLCELGLWGCPDGDWGVPCTLGPTPATPLARRVRKIALYSDLIHSVDWKSAIEHDGGV